MHGTYGQSREVSTKEDYLIVCNDVGVCGFSASEEAEARNILHRLLVTRDMEIAKQCYKIIRMENGKVKEYAI